MSKITNLIGTTWRLDKDTVRGIPQEYGKFNITANGTFFGIGSSVSCISSAFWVGYAQITGGEPVAFPDTVSVYVDEASDGTETLYNVFLPISLLQDYYYEFTITGGDNISNPLFIDFINTYGTLVSGGEPPTAEGVKTKLQSLITASNAKTGKSDANLTDAVKTLLEGYGQGGGGGSVIPLRVTENGTYDNAVTYEYEYGTARIDANTVWDNTVEMDGATKLKKIAAYFPDDLTQDSILNMGIATKAYIPAYDITMEEPVGESDIHASEDFAIVGQFLFYVKNASVLNAQLGVDVFEDNSVYVMFPEAYLDMFEYLEITLPVAGKVIEHLGFFPVEVDVYVPPTSDETLVITAPSAGSSTSKTMDTYYKKFQVNSLPTQSVTVELTDAQQVIYADSGKVLRSVTVPALPKIDVSTSRIPCGISIEQYPKTVYTVNDTQFNLDDGKLKVCYTNGETAIIDISVSYTGGFVPSMQKGAGLYTIRIVYEEDGYTLYTSFQITRGDLCMITINGKKYGACEGMTWKNWVDGDFNKSYSKGTSKYKVDENTSNVMYGDATPVLYNGVAVKATDTIVGGAEYTHGTT